MNGLRTVYLVLGWIMLGLGAAGAVLPLLPTTPFVLAAAWFFTRSSPRVTAWLLKQPVLGPSLGRWRLEGAISTRAKLVAVSSIIFGYVSIFSLGQFSPMILAILAIILLAVAIFIVSRPSPSGWNPVEGA